MASKNTIYIQSKIFGADSGHPQVKALYALYFMLRKLRFRSCDGNMATRFKIVRAQKGWVRGQ